MKLRNILGVAAALIVVVAAAGYVVLVPGEAERPPPAGMTEPKLVPLSVPFTHRWAKATSHARRRGHRRRRRRARRGVPQRTAGRQNTFTASFVDLDRDGWPDLVLAQNTGEVEILRYGGDSKFARPDFHSGYDFWMGLAFGDVDRDGGLDIFLSNIGNSIPALLVKGDRRDDQKPANEWLPLRNDGGFRFTDITAAAGVGGFGFGWGGVFEDVNLDGAPDLLVAENYVKWSVHRLFKLPGKLLLGDPGTGAKFYTSDAASNAAYGHVPLIADVDGDGRNDIVWANMDGAARAYLNRTDGRFVSVRLADSPASIGARIRLAGVPAPVQVFIAGEGLTSDRTTQFTFGLAKDGPAPAAQVVEWADGQVTRIPAPPENKTIFAVRPP